MNDVVITVLAGGRPDLLAETLRSLRDRAPGVLEESTVVAMNNGGDAGTFDVLDEFREVVDRRIVTPRVRPIGRAVSTLANWAQRSERRYWLHLEDDWECHPVDGWLDVAKEMLLDGADQVRLRREGEPVLAKHMVTGRPLDWAVRGGHRWSVEAHYTLNPSLVWTGTIGDAWPASGERAAQRRWHGRGRGVAVQHSPGVFGHLGEGRSLRAETGCEA